MNRKNTSANNISSALVRTTVLIATVLIGGGPCFAQTLRSGRSVDAVITMAKENPAFADTLKDRTRFLGKLIDTPELMLPNLWPTTMFDTDPGTASEAQRFGVDQVIFDFLNTPEAIIGNSNNQESLNQILGHENLDTWMRATRSYQDHLQTRQELRDKLDHIFTHHRMADIGSLNKLFDHAAVTIHVDGSAFPVLEEPIQKAAQGDRKALNQVLGPYLKGSSRTKGTPRVEQYRGLRIAVLDSGDIGRSKPGTELERAVMELSPGVQAIAIQNPSNAEMDMLPEDEGWFATALKTRWVRSVIRKPVVSSEKAEWYRDFPYVLDLSDRDRKKFKERLNASSNVPFDILDLTEENFRNIFFPIYRQMITEEKGSGGKLLVDEDEAEKIKKTSVGLKAWKLFLFFHPENVKMEETKSGKRPVSGEIIGAVLVNIWPERSLITLAYGGGLITAKASKKEIIEKATKIILGPDHKLSFAEATNFNGLGAEFATRMLHEGIMYTLENRLGLLSKGMDPSFFVEYANPKADHDYDNAKGMINTKAQDGMLGFLNGPLWLMKWFDYRPYNEMLFHVIRRDSELLRRYFYLRDRSSIAPPVHALWGEPFFGPEALEVAKQVALHYWVRPRITTPHGVEIIAHPMRGRL